MPQRPMAPPPGHTPHQLVDFAHLTTSQVVQCRNSADSPPQSTPPATLGAHVFVTLEGIDRSGKTTQAARLQEALGPGTLLLREPGGTAAGERVRAILKDPDLELDPASELLLFAAARAELCRRVVAPALAEGRDVVCDRFIDSTAAYQGVARGLGLEVVERLNDFAIAGCVPDLTVLLRIDPAEALERGQQRLAEGAEDGTDRFESEGADLQHRVAAAYDELASRHRDRIAVIDAAGSPDEVHAAVLDLVRAHAEGSGRARRFTVRAPRER